jgi:predicted GH43/DUF377 family glycosyl hydrolase
MIHNPHTWMKLGRILTPSAEIDWMVSHTGATSCIHLVENRFKLFVTGRDKNNRSRIGCFDFTLDKDRFDIKNPLVVLELGSPGCFDENGTSYPYVVPNGKEYFMYYTGWMPTVLVPFQNHLGLAKSTDLKKFQRVSKAPILERTDDDHLSIGSVCVMRKGNQWHMWYTSFTKWEKVPGQEKLQHHYLIKYASSKDGMHWQRNNEICIGPKNSLEHSISRPTIVEHNDLYHMWYCYRGDQYKIGYAYSEDAISWKRSDESVGIDGSPFHFDSKSMAYPFVFKHQNALYMIYAGNDYGNEGIGLAKLES